MTQITCPNCRRPLDVDGMFIQPGDQFACPACHGHFVIPGPAPNTFSGPVIRNDSSGAQALHVAKRYPVLRSIANGYRLLGFIALIIGVVVAVYIVLSPDIPVPIVGRALGAVFALVSAVSVALFYFAIAEVLCVFLDLEENTRRTSLLLNRVSGKLTAPVP